MQQTLGWIHGGAVVCLLLIGTMALAGPGSSWNGLGWPAISGITALIGILGSVAGFVRRNDLRAIDDRFNNVERSEDRDRAVYRDEMEACQRDHDAHVNDVRAWMERIEKKLDRAIEREIKP